MTTASISADSHVSEIDETFADIDPRFREDRPRATFDEKLGGAVFSVPNLGVPVNVPMGLVCAAGRPPQEFGRVVTWEELHPAGHDGKQRLALQDEENISAEIIYPSMGMVLCNHPDPDYKKACFDAYNRWLLEFCEADPERLVSLPIISLRTVEEGIAELQEAADRGQKGVMLSGNPVVEDFDHPCYDPFWEACVDLNLPVSFHILTTRGDITDTQRGNKIIQHLITIRGNQDIMALLIFGGVFERNPKLKVVCVEADAGWIPHFNFRMDHTYNRHRHWQKYDLINRNPSEYFNENIYVTFQDDYSVGHVINAMNHERVLWASDFPHSDGTYPHTRKVIDSLSELMTKEQARRIFTDNTAELYGLGV